MTQGNETAFRHVPDVTVSMTYGEADLIGKGLTLLAETQDDPQERERTLVLAFMFTRDKDEAVRLREEVHALRATR